MLLQFEWVLNGLGWIWQIFVDQFFGWLAGIAVTLLVLFLRPKAMFRWARLTFPIRHRNTTITASGLATFSFPPLSMSLSELRDSFVRVKAFTRIESATLEMQDRLRVVSRVGTNSIEYDLIPLENDDEELVGIMCICSRQIAFGGIDEFIDFVVAGRGTVFRALMDVGVMVRFEPDIVVTFSWDSSKMSILPWLKNDYVFDGSIQIEGTNVSIYYSDQGAAVKADTPSPLLRDVLKNLVVDNFMK